MSDKDSLIVVHDDPSGVQQYCKRLKSFTKSLILFGLFQQQQEAKPDVTMEVLLTPVSTLYEDKREKDALIEVKEPQKPHKPSFKASTPAEALQVLKNEPDHESLISTLRFLSQDSSEFNITAPSPIAAQLVHVLVSDIVPSYWPLLFESKKPRRKRAKSKNEPELELLLSCLRSVAGLNALLLNMKQLIQQSKENNKAVGGANIQDCLTILLQVLTEVIHGDDLVENISNALWSSTTRPQQQKATWNELLGITGSGKIVGLAAEAEDAIGELSKKILERCWVADGSAYSCWLARNITHWAKSLPKESENEWRNCGELLCKAFRLGYSGNFQATTTSRKLTNLQRISSKRSSHAFFCSANTTLPSLRCS